MVSDDHPDDQDHVRDAIPSQVRGTYDLEYRIIRPDGSTRWIHDRCFPIYDAQGNVSRLAGVARDITERRQFEEQLRQQALYDSLTGLPNRTLLRERLGRALARMQRHADYHFAVLFLDLDRFKTLNDSMGHTAGDQVLIGVAHRLETCVRPGDTVARLGGDEFVLFLDDIVEHSDVLAITQRVQQQLSFPFVLQEQEFLTTTSIGIAWSVPSYTNPDEILRDADAAMYRAKAAGRAGYEVFDPGMRAATLAALRVERELRHAIDDGSFELHYQPIVAVQGGRIIGAEALVRWQHPRYGRIAPDQFIPVAEESGLIVPLGKWVLRAACQAAASWRAAGLAFGYIAVNMAARQLRAPDLLETIDEVLRETGLPPQALRLELTESGLMEHFSAAQTALEQIKARGIGLAIDDFGTGYSSLAYLHRFPVDTVKIDRAFISALGTGNDAIATAAIAMAHGLHLRVVAEGVETDAQVAFLHAHRCEAMQGFLISKPLPLDDFQRLLASHTEQPLEHAPHLIQAS